RALQENSENPRYRWLGELTYQTTREILAASHLLAITSRIEGSANVLGEALISSVPVVASKIPGIVGTLGADYPGYFPLEDTDALAKLLLRAERDHQFYQLLKDSCQPLVELVSPARELAAWQELLSELQRTS